MATERLAFYGYYLDEMCRSDLEDTARILIRRLENEQRPYLTMLREIGRLLDPATPTSKEGE